MKENLVKALKRIGYALPFAVFCGYCVSKGMGGDGTTGGTAQSVSWLLYAAAMLIVVATIFAFPIAEFIGTRLGRFYFSGPSVVPPPHYLLAQRYEQEHKWDLALAEFDKIVRNHPAELPAHLARIRLALVGLEDEGLARRFLTGSLGTLHDPDFQAHLRQYWQTLADTHGDEQPPASDPPNAAMAAGARQP